MASKSCKIVREIPNDLIFSNILPRLPVKSALKFKSVSHEWNSVISSQKYFEDRSKFHNQILFLRRTQGQPKPKGEISTIIYRDETSELIDVVHLTPCAELGERYAHFALVGSVRGLICLSFDLEDEFGIWNPIRKNLTSVPFPYGMSYNTRMCIRSEGFGYTASRDDYTIVALFSERKAPHHTCRIFLFSLRNFAWKEILIPNGEVIVEGIENSTGFTVDEAVYWAFVETDTTTETKFVSSILKFDLGAEEMVKELMPDEFKGYKYERVTHVFGKEGSLGLCCFRNQEPYHVWVKNDEGTWMNVYSIDGEEVYLMGFISRGRYLTNDTQQFKLLQLEIREAQQQEERPSSALHFAGRIIFCPSLPYSESFSTFNTLPQV